MALGQRQGATVVLRGPGETLDVARVDLKSGVGTVLLQQVATTDPVAGAPYALLRATIGYGIDGARFVVQADWQMGTRIVVPGDSVDLSVSYEPTDIARQPVTIIVSGGIVDGAPAPPTPWGYTVRCNQLAAGAAQVVQVPQGAHDVALYAPAAAAWGGIILRQETGNGASVLLEYNPTTPAPVELLPGVRWIEVINNTPGSLRPFIRFGLA